MEIKLMEMSSIEKFDEICAKRNLAKRDQNVALIDAGGTPLTITGEANSALRHARLAFNQRMTSSPWLGAAFHRGG